MVNFERFELSQDGNKLYIETSSLEEAYATEFRLYTEASYQDKNKAFQFNSKLTPNSSVQEFEIDANEIGELIFEGLYIAEIVYDIPAGPNSITYTKQAIAVNMSKVYTCIVRAASSLEVDCCKLVLKDNDCACVEDILHSFIELESFKILIKNEEYKLAIEVWNSLNEKCSINCTDMFDEALYPGIGISTINNKIVE